MARPTTGDADTRRRGVSKPLSFNQERELYRGLFSRLHRSPPIASNLAMRFVFDTPVNHTAVERALNEVASRHDVLRTGYDIAGPKWLWALALPFARLTLISKRARRLAAWTLRRLNRANSAARVTPFQSWTVPQATVPFQVVDARLPNAGAMKVVLKLRLTPFDLTRPPLVRAALVVHPRAREILTVVVSHFAFDWASSAVFRREFLTAYHAYADGRDPALPPVSFQYAAFSAWQRERFSGLHLKECLEYWCERLPQFSPFFTPVRVDELRYCQRRPSRRRLSRSRELRIAGDRYTQFRAYCATARVTPYMVLLAALGLVLHEASNRDPVVIWMAFSNRLNSETEHLIGWVEQTLPLRLDFAGQPSDREIVDRARAAVLGALEFPMPPPLLSLHQGFEIPAGEELASNHVGFDFRTEPNDTPAVESAAAAQPANAFSDFALQISAFQGPAHLRVQMLYSLDWFGDESATELLDDFAATLDRMTGSATA